MRTFASLVLAVSLLAGCSSDPPAADPQATPTDTDGTVRGICVDEAIRPIGEPNADGSCPMYERPIAVAVTGEGNTGAYAHQCAFVPPQPQCGTTDMGTDAADVLFANAGTNFTGLDLNITWTSTNALTASLTFGYMVMADCDGCDWPATFFGEEAGTSPVRLQVSGENIPLNETMKVHIYAYIPQGQVYQDPVPAYAVVSVEQAYHVEGKLFVVESVRSTFEPETDAS